MKIFTIISILTGTLLFTHQFAMGQAEVSNKNDPTLKPMMIEDFEDQGVLERIGTTPGVTIALTEEGATSGKYALEVRVAPFSEHKNQWPYIYLIYPKIFKAPMDLTHYSNISMTIEHVTDGLAQLYIQGSTLPYNDGGRNFTSEGFLIPSGTRWTCDLPTANFIYTGTKDEGGKTVVYNDPSNVQLIQIVFPPNEKHAVYRIDGIQARYDPAIGSPDKTLKTQLEKLKHGFGELKQRINWNNLGESKRQSVKHQCTQLVQVIKKLSQDYRNGSSTGFQGNFIDLQRRVDNASRQLRKLLLVDKKNFFAWEVDPYLTVFKDESPDFENTELETLEIQMAGNEFRDAVFMVSACSNDVELEVAIEADANLPADAILIQETLYLKNSVGQETGDAVYALTGPLSIAKNQSRQIRLRFDSRYTAINPGQYAFTLRLSDLKTGVVKRIPGRLTVWDFALPSYDILANNSYALFDNSEFSVPALTAKAVAHMKMYGLNHVFIHPVEMPHPVVDAQGNLLGFDSEVFENRIRSIQQGWQSAPGSERLKYMLCALVINTFHLDRPDIDYTDKSKHATEKWKIIFPKWYDYLKQTTRRLGIADEDLIMVLHDEPSEAWMLNGVIPLAQAIKEVDPDVVITSNTSNTITDPVMAKKFHDLMDIFQPHLPELKSSPQLLEWLKSSGKCPVENPSIRPTSRT